MDAWWIDVVAMRSEHPRSYKDVVAAYCFCDDGVEMKDFKKKLKPFVEYFTRNAKYPCFVHYDKYSGAIDDWGSEAVICFTNETDSFSCAVWVKLKHFDPILGQTKAF